jgi:predicted transposase YbfD/YdcC
MTNDELINGMLEHFSDVETTEEHNGYFFSVREALIIVILGSICGLRNVSQIHQWALSDSVRKLLADALKIWSIPSYYWLTRLLKLIKPESLNECFINWVQSMLKSKAQTISLDGKTVRSTAKMKSFDSPLHIVSAQIAELGITFGQVAVSDKSNEIPAVRTLLEMLDISGCMIVADAMNCQKATAKVIIRKGADYLLDVKDNQQALKTEIEEYVQDEELRAAMETAQTDEINRGRREVRTAYATSELEWLLRKNDWENLVFVGAINTRFSSETGTSDEWHYYISSRRLSPEQLLVHARREWSVETMHWLLDVHFTEDACRLRDKNEQLVLNMARKIALNVIKTFKLRTGDKRAMSKIMLACLLDSAKLSELFEFGES